MGTSRISIKGLLLSSTNRKPLAGVTIEAWGENQVFSAAIGRAVSDNEGKFEIGFLDRRVIAILLEKRPKIFFKMFVENNLITSTEGKINWNVDVMDEPIVVTIDWPNTPVKEDENPKAYAVKGKAVNSNGVALGNMTVELLVKTIERDIVVGKTVTAADGSYSISLNENPMKGSPDFQVRAYDKSNEKNFALSKVIYNASKTEVLDVIVPASRLRKPSEYNTILTDTQNNLGHLTLAQLKEDKEVQHITYLSNKTGWDARLTAMLASAHQLGQQLKLDPSHVYALLRSGVPGTADALQSLSSADAERALKTAIDKNIIPASTNIPETIKSLNTLSVGYMLTNKPFASVSSMGDMLSIRLNQEQTNVFAQIRKSVGTDSAKLWSELKARGFTNEVIAGLQLDGKMGFLTGNNAPLIKKVYENYRLKNDVELASSGLYKASEWKKIIGNTVPTDISADEYANHLANQVKMSYPTAIAAEMVQRDEIKLGSNTPKEEVVKFFRANQSKNTLGSQPTKSWQGFDSLSTAAKAAVKTYERLYQISPSNEAMTAMAAAGLDSAYQVAKYTQAEFLSTFGKSFPDEQQAQLSYTKANEVYSASLGIATTYITNRAMPNIYAITGQLTKTPNETIAYPTLEELFGNMDYCACDHCKSVLSPAAYMVELLQFIDMTGIPIDKSNPVKVLLDRRPDIQHIQLTCENTNMALPYIDLVNEILEHYILNGNLDNLKGHDVTPETTQATLLAEPQFVEKTAYDLLKTKVYPYNLPFNQPLETLRSLFKMWDISLANALNIFSTPLAARKETLAFNEEEYQTITNKAFKPIAEYYGRPGGTTIAQLNAAISSGKEFSRTVGISYEDLTDLLKTNFINPGYSIVPLFQKLHINLVDLQKFYDGTITNAQMDTMIPPGTIAADYGGDVKAWLRSHQQLIMGLVTLTDLSADGTECNFAEVVLRYALPDNNSNSLTALTYHKFHRFLRLLRKTGWNIFTLDNLLKAVLPIPSADITESNIDATFVTVFNRLSNFKKIADYLSYSEKKYYLLLQILDLSSDLSFRQVQAAKLLKLSMPELVELTAISGIDPLANDLEADEPSFLKMVMLTRHLKELSLKVVDLAYLLHHRDLNNNITPSNESVLLNLKILRDTVNQVEKENSIAPDNADFNFAKGKMLLVYDAATTDQFFGFLLNTTSYTAPFLTVEEVLPAPILLADAGLGFDPFKKELTHTGSLASTTKTALVNAADALALGDMGVISTAPDLANFVTGFKAALNVLSTASNVQLLAFGTDYPELKTIYDTAMAESTTAGQVQKLVDLLIPGLNEKLKANALKQALAGILKADAEVVSVITASKETVSAAANALEPVLYDFLQLAEKANFNQNITYDFYVDIPANDDYLLYVTAPQNTVVQLILDGQTIINNVIVGANEEVQNTGSLALKTGLKKASLKLSALPAGKEARLLWRTKGVAKSLVPDGAISLSARVNFASTSLIRLSKASQLRTLFGLTADELAYFAAVNTETKDILNNLDPDGSIGNPALLALWKKIELLAYFKSIKKENEPEENTWLQVLKDPAVKNVQGQLLLESFNLWQEADVTELLTHFVLNRNDLSKLSALKKLKTAIEIIYLAGYPAALVKTWINPNPSYDLVAGIKETVRQQVSEAAWLETMQTVSDPVRNLVRDALVSYILQYQKPSAEIVNADKLYEYFLIDVEMDACMKTSRIRQALSTIQLFIQRCLINLEPNVDPASIRAEQWAWMKRYRVWEANRKVFLYPENWLEPELRDNKSSLFKELEGELLQGEITDESAELAFLNYLKKLDDIAKLEMVGMYLEENEKNNQDDDILHVFGRTMGNTRQYYYRRYEYGYWTPWEKVNLNIEGEHIFPIIWRKRLFVFWFGIFTKPAPVNGTKSAQGMSNDSLATNARKNVEITVSWGEYYKGKWTSPKSTDLKRPMLINDLPEFNSKDLLVYGRKDLVENPVGKFRERIVFDVVYGDIMKITGRGYYGAGGTFTFTSKNAAPLIDLSFHDTQLITGVHLKNKDLLRKPYEALPQKSSLYHTQFLVPSMEFQVNVKQPVGASAPEKIEDVLSKKNVLKTGFELLPTRHPVENFEEAPLSYADEHSTFFVQPDEDVFIAIWEYEPYYPIYETPILENPPILIEKPIKNWPPEEIFDPWDEIVNPGVDEVTNPWEWNRESMVVNTNLTKMLAGTQIFNFGEVEFGATGKNKGMTQNTF